MYNGFIFLIDVKKVNEHVFPLRDVSFPKTCFATVPRKIAR